MKLGIMQPYFLPYIGYWQLLGAVDAFVLYDNIQYTKKGWINRNRFLKNDSDALFTIPLRKDSDFLNVIDRMIADEFDPERLLNQLAGSYRKAPFFSRVFPLLGSIVACKDRNLFGYIEHSIRCVAEFLDIKTPIVISSTLQIDHSLRGEQKVLALCRAMGASHYINPVGGQELYSKPAFKEFGITLEFLQARPIRYPQFSNEFVSNLSIVDVLMFNQRESVVGMLQEYDLL